MFKNLLLAGAVVMAGSAWFTTSAQAGGPWGFYGPGYRAARPVYVAPPVRAYRPVIVQPQVIQPAYGYSYGYSGYGYNAPPVYRSYRAPVGVGLGGYGVPYYGSTWGNTSGISISIGR